MKEVKAFYEQVKCPPEVSQQRLDDAFDLLFEEVFKQMQLKKQKQNQSKGGEVKNGYYINGDRNRVAEANTRRFV